MSSSSFDFFAGFFHVVRTKVSEKTKSVLLDLAGVPDVTHPDDDDAGELAPEQLAYGPLGLLVNPLDVGKMPDGVTPAQADYLGVRTADGVIPVVGWDPRIAAAFPNGPAKGTVALAGYAGGFHSIDLTNNGTSNIHVIYAPIPGEEEAQAHAIILDTTNGNESVSAVHYLGQGLFMTHDGKLYLKSADGSASVFVKNGEVDIFGNVVISGGVVMGNPSSAVPLVMFPDLSSYIGSLELALTNAFTAITPVGGGPAALSAWGAHTTNTASLLAAMPTTTTKAF